MAGPVPERGQVMSMDRSPNVIYTCVTLLKGMATMTIIVEYMLLITAQMRNDIHETLYSLNEHLLNTADLRTITFDTCGLSAARALPS
jgi:hypothetical protein